MLITGLIASAAIIFLLLKFNIRRVLNYEILIDVSVTVLLMIIFAGTFAGMMTGLMAGAVISIFLYVARRTIGYEKPGILKTKSFPYRRPGWVRVTPEGKET